jgi:hypothetical protein
MRRVLVLWCFLCLAGGIELFSYNGYGQDSQTKEALKEIGETADDIARALHGHAGLHLGSSEGIRAVV